MANPVNIFQFRSVCGLRTIRAAFLSPRRSSAGRGSAAAMTANSKSTTATQLIHSNTAVEASISRLFPLTSRVRLTTIGVSMTYENVFTRGWFLYLTSNKIKKTKKKQIEKKKRFFFSCSETDILWIRKPLDTAGCVLCWVVLRSESAAAWYLYTRGFLLLRGGPHRTQYYVESRKVTFGNSC